MPPSPSPSSSALLWDLHTPPTPSASLPFPLPFLLHHTSHITLLPSPQVTFQCPEKKGGKGGGRGNFPGRGESSLIISPTSAFFSKVSVARLMSERKANKHTGGVGGGSTKGGVLRKCKGGKVSGFYREEPIFHLHFSCSSISFFPKA